MSDTQDVTRVLREIRDDPEDGLARLFPLVYDELRRVAHRQLSRRRPGETLGTTALVNEAYLRLVDHSRAEWNDRVHFLAVAARAMRHILIDYARRQQAEKRGGGQVHVTLDDAVAGSDGRAGTLIALDEALERLAELSPRLAKVVEYRFFGGLREAEIAAMLGTSERTVQRDWRLAKAWLARELTTPASG